MATPKATKVQKSGQAYYRVRVRRPSKGINVDEYFRTKRLADAFIRELEHAIDHGKPVQQNVGIVVTFSEAADRYLKSDLTSRKGLPLKPSTAANRQTRIRVLKNLFGSLRLKRLTWEHVCTTLDAQGWGPANRYRYETALSRFLAYCKRQGWVAINVADGQERIDRTKSRQRTYTNAEWVALLDAADEQTGMLAMFLRLAWATGARKSELLNLRWVDIDPLEHETLGASLWLRETKSGDDRKVYVDKSLSALLLAHEQEFRVQSSPLVFPSRTRHGRYSVDPFFRLARTTAGLDEPDDRHGEVLNIHHIRHTFATRLGDSGATLAQLMAAGGWKTPGMAARYMKRRDSQAAEAAMLLAVAS